MRPQLNHLVSFHYDIKNGVIICFYNIIIADHVRSHSGISLDNGSDPTMGEEDIYLAWLQAIRAHQQPVSCLEYGGGRVLTGSMDHTIRIFRLEDHFNIYTLHGHCGPISTAFVDGTVANCAGSGSQDGMICVWDLLTGACMYSILAHDGEVLCLTYSPSYVISMGADSKLCVWERFQGHLINTILLVRIFSIHRALRKWY